MAATEQNPAVPAEAQAALQAIVESGQAQWYLSGGEKIEFTVTGFCAWYMAERQRIREQVAKEAHAAADRFIDGSDEQRQALASDAATLRWFADYILRGGS